MSKEKQKSKEEVQQLVDEGGMLNSRNKKNKKKEDEIKKILKKVINIYGEVMSNDSLILEGNTFELVVTTKPSYDIPVEKVWEFVEKDIEKFLKVVKISTSNLTDEYGKNKVDELKEKISETESMTFRKKED